MGNPSREKIAELRRRIAAGDKERDIARDLKLSISTVRRYGPVPHKDAELDPNLASDWMYREEPSPGDQVREIKVRIPMRLLIKLHGLKLLSNRNISDTVTEAIDEYFAARSRSAGADPQ